MYQPENTRLGSAGLRRDFDNLLLLVELVNRGITTLLGRIVLNSSPELLFVAIDAIYDNMNVELIQDLSNTNMQYPRELNLR